MRGSDADGRAVFLTWIWRSGCERSIRADGGRSPIPPERLLRALLLQALYTIRVERQLMEQLKGGPPRNGSSVLAASKPGGLPVRGFALVWHRAGAARRPGPLLLGYVTGGAALGPHRH
jgi:Transposase domain (DUF772)